MASYDDESIAGAAGHVGISPILEEKKTQQLLFLMMQKNLECGQELTNGFMKKNG